MIAPKAISNRKCRRHGYPVFTVNKRSINDNGSKPLFYQGDIHGLSHSCKKTGPRRSVIVFGLEESDLANDVRKAAEELAIQVQSDPWPERGIFTRSDQYSFIKRGIPALAINMGFRNGSGE